MSFNEFMDVHDKKQEDGSSFYYSEDYVPAELRGDFSEPSIAEKTLRLKEVNMWMGMETISLAHTDAMENFMCVAQGTKVFYIVSSMQRNFLYAGMNMPPNYSPVDFKTPDLQKYPMFRKAKVDRVPLEAGDCIFLPAYYWHQVESFPTEDNKPVIAVNHWYESSQKIVDHVFTALENNLV